MLRVCVIPQHGEMWVQSECQQCVCDQGQVDCNKACDLSYDNCAEGYMIQMYPDDRCCECVPTPATTAAPATAAPGTTAPATAAPGTTAPVTAAPVFSTAFTSPAGTTVLPESTTPKVCSPECYCQERCDGSMTCDPSAACGDECQPCPSGYIWKGTHCVAEPNNCACYYDGVRYEPGQSWEAGACRFCKCEDYQAVCEHRCNIQCDQCEDYQAVCEHRCNIQCDQDEELVDNTPEDGCCYCQSTVTTTKAPTTEQPQYTTPRVSTMAPVKTTPQLTTTTQAICYAKLGLEDGSIPDDRISYSSAGSPGVGRLSGEPWTPAADSLPSEEYIQVDFLEPTQITSIATQGSGGSAMWVRKFAVQYSADGSEWLDYTEQEPLEEGEQASPEPKIFHANTNDNSMVENRLSSTVVARYVRVLPVDWEQAPALRLEFIGCPYTRGKC
ncbi:SCO-spondin-like [Branchiostoma floridae x Branchiostoma belcheri]